MSKPKIFAICYRPWSWGRVRGSCIWGRSRRGRSMSTDSSVTSCRGGYSLKCWMSRLSPPAGGDRPRPGRCPGPWCRGPSRRSAGTRRPAAGGHPAPSWNGQYLVVVKNISLTINYSVFMITNAYKSNVSSKSGKRVRRCVLVLCFCVSGNLVEGTMRREM